MDTLAVIVPVKGTDPKSRLASVLDQRQRKQLVVAMLEDVLQAIIKARLIQHTYVVSSDNEILRFAERFGANPVEEREERGVNNAVKLGMGRARGYREWLVLPADIPFLDSKDIGNVITLSRLGARLVISPSENLDGTNLLLLRKGASIELRYDDDSFRNHTREAMDNSIPLSMYYSQTVAFDIDSSRELYRAFKIGKRCSTLTYLGRVLGKRTLKPTMQKDENNRSYSKL